jgi:hypothetical protein
MIKMRTKVGIKSLRHFLFFIFFRESSFDNYIQIVISIALRVSYKPGMVIHFEIQFFDFLLYRTFFSRDHKFKALLIFATFFRIK